MEGMKYISNKQARASVDLQQNDGATPLFVAAQNDNDAVVKTLVEACSDSATTARPYDAHLADDLLYPHEPPPHFFHLVHSFHLPIPSHHIQIQL